MKFQRIISSLSVIVLAALAVGCAGLNAGSLQTPPAATGSSSGGSTSDPITGTSVVSSGGGVSNTLSGTPAPVDLTTPLTADATGSLAVTQMDSGRTLMMQVGQRFLLNLGEAYDWSFSIDDQTIVSRVVNILTIRGSQGIFEAHQAGTTILHAAGDPPCRQSTPPCMMPSVDFQIQITVQ